MRIPRACSCSRRTGSATSSWRCRRSRISASASPTPRWWSRRAADSRRIFESVPGVDRDRPARRTRHDVDTLRQAGADAALLLPNSFRSALADVARRYAGTLGLSHRCAGLLLTEPSSRLAAPRVHQATYYQQLTTALGCEAGPLRARLQHDSEPTARPAPGARSGRLEGRARSSASLPAPPTARPNNGIPNGWGRWRRASTRSTASSRASSGRAATRSGREVVEPRRARGAAGTRAQPGGRTSTCAVDRRHGALRGIPVERLGRDAPGGALDVPVVAVFGPTREWATSPLPGPRGAARSS